MIRPDFADLRVAERFFAPGEVRRLRALDPSARNVAFLRCWTRKESVLKAIGAGLTVGLSEFEVSFDSSQDARLLSHNAALGTGDWHLRDVSDLVPGCVAALAISSAPGRPAPAE